ncbi:outer membrane protein A precursor [Vibrio ishigakensis]|uniref:Outer membrane protein A n=1 Tax=Vibrio ishigakensis TaxID=1481914 RepID=A0A0B8P4S1_9VIBR|nr:OmpA family protein [Vibrio ishigakensis]GAM59592.1 outer membrane protein A precursor [Vibrio ishigakensis]
MKFIVGAFALAMGTSVALAAEGDVNANIEQLCSSEHMLIKHSVNIAGANAVVANRAQYYQIQPELSDEQKSRLATSNISLGDDCIEYLAKAEVLEVDSDGVVARVYFNFDKSELTETSKLTLTTLAERLQSLQQVPDLDVVGHTDNLGSEKYNQGLGENRALTSQVFLVDSGVEKEVLSTHSKGLSEPIRDNATSEGRAINRRVEIKLSDPS